MLQSYRDGFATLAGQGVVKMDFARLHLGWERACLRSNGTLTMLERQVVEAAVAYAMKRMSLFHDKARVTLAEWLHYMLVRPTNRFEQLNPGLRDLLTREPEALMVLQDAFEDIQVARKGSSEAAVEVCASLAAQRMWPFFQGPLRPVYSSCVDFVAEFVSTVRSTDTVDDECLLYVELVACCLGRQRKQVVLNLYDISRGTAAVLSPMVIGQTVSGVWHAGVVAFDREYYFSGLVESDQPNNTKFGTPSQTISYGHTRWSQDEFHDFVCRKLKKRFSRGGYDIVTNNCNHFADSVMCHLVGAALPREVVTQSQLLREIPMLSAVVKPILEWYARRSNIALETQATASEAAQKHASRMSEGGLLVKVAPVSGVECPTVGVVADSTDAPAEVQRPEEDEQTSYVLVT
eukprot:TRINITY_DN28946_c0_g1_i2.p1 TRINITY_DN28946_c0_g1~~TRINITY_DN28946_c0_g1_i2.p1  ORF type:complete len:406 (+),score=73.11 TRINITY_DN28946_c0_g1_i2:95-1312(+)